MGVRPMEMDPTRWIEVEVEGGDDDDDDDEDDL